MGQIPSDMLEGRDYAYRAIFTQKALNWPIEPLRYRVFHELQRFRGCWTDGMTRLQGERSRAG